jgi:uncharacterized membrane protein YoaK (UPF0700 family)
VISDPSRRITLAAVLLTLGTGATDVVSFTRLGGVFTSVMTGNIVLFGLAAARASARLAEHTAVAFAGYVLGAAAGARVVAFSPQRQRRARDSATKKSTPEDSTAKTIATDTGTESWPAMVSVALTVEFALLAVFAAGWELTGTRPAGTDQYLLQVTAATAMGLQSAAVRAVGAGDFATTYLTGTLTAVIGRLVTPGQRRWPGWRQPGALLALAAGALISGILIAQAPAADPVIILTPLCAVLVIDSMTRRDRRAMAVAATP